MNTESILIRPSTVAALLAGFAVTQAPDASAQVTVNAGILTINAPAGGLNSRILAGPAPGVVQLFQVPGAPNGQRLTGIQAVRVLSGAGPDQLEFDIRQNTPFEVFADTGAGNSDIKVKWVVPPTASPVNPKLNLLQGAGSKKVWFDFESYAATVDLDWNVRGTGQGAGEVKSLVAFQQGSLNTTADLHLQSGTGTDKLDLVIDSMSDNLRLDVVSRGAEIVTTQVLADDPGTRLDVLYDVMGTSRPNLVEFQLDSAVSNVWVDYVIDGGTQVDEVKLGMTQLVPGVIQSTLDIDTGAAADKVDVKFDGQASELRLSGLVQGADGSDEIKLYSEFETTSDAVLAGGAGNDQLLAEIKGPLSSIGSNPLRFAGGLGNDTMVLKADGGVVGTPPVLDGGAGFDSASGPAQTVNVEVVQ
jgi:hypothetical protein